MKGMKRFERKGKLSLRYIKLFEILHAFGDVAYKLDFPLYFFIVH